jgi:hypothetical protein
MPRPPTGVAAKETEAEEEVATGVSSQRDLLLVVDWPLTDLGVASHEED